MLYCALNTGLPPSDVNWLHPVYRADLKLTSSLGRLPPLPELVQEANPLKPIVFHPPVIVYCAGYGDYVKRCACALHMKWTGQWSALEQSDGLSFLCTVS